MTRIKSPAQRAPQTKEQAIAVLGEYARDAATVAMIEAARADAIAQINAKADAELVPLHAGLKDKAKQLKPWWAANIDDLTGGKRKSIDLGGCSIGYRMTPPKVNFSGGTDADAVITLQANGFGERLVRVTPAPDKPALLKLLESVFPDPQDGGELTEEQVLIKADVAKLEDLGFSVKQTEQFFVDALTPIADDAKRTTFEAE